MKINFSSSKEDSLYHYTLFLLGISETDTTTFPVAPFIRSANTWTRKTIFEIWKNSAGWEFDDSNHTDLPIATTTLVNGQQDYSLPTEALDILRVEVLDSSGDYQLMKLIDKSEVGESLSEYYETAGMPFQYDLLGNSIFLYPKPSTSQVTAAKGLKLYLSRDIDEFTITDTSQQPGFVNSFHEIIAFGSAYDFAIANGIQNKITILRREIDRINLGIEDYYSQRPKGSKKRIMPSIKSSI